MRGRGRLQFEVDVFNHVPDGEQWRLLSWCFTNIGDGGHLPFYKDETRWSDPSWCWAFFFAVFYFDNEEDATLFALTYR